MDLIEICAMQAKCIINLMTVVARNNLSITQKEDLPSKAYDIGCLVGMLEAEVFKLQINRKSIVENLPFKDEILTQFVNGIMSVIHRVLLDENQQQLAQEQERLDSMRQELEKNLHHTESLLNNTSRLEAALRHNKLYEDSADVLGSFQKHVDVMRNMQLVKSQEHNMLNVLLDKNEQLLQSTEQSLQALPAADTTKMIDLKEEFLRLEGKA